MKVDYSLTFKEFTKLTSIRGASVETIGCKAFGDCANLTSVSLSATPPSSRTEGYINMLEYTLENNEFTRRTQRSFSNGTQNYPAAMRTRACSLSLQLRIVTRRASGKRRDWTTGVNTAFEKGVDQGVAEGMAKGIAEEKIDAAKNALSEGLPVDIIKNIPA
ncbi:MAG: hypothetical protein LBG43_01900 [Treponema sp.]|nr:hypothetical protein [Treponema sp.]